MTKHSDDDDDALIFSRKVVCTIYISFKYQCDMLYDDDDVSCSLRMRKDIMEQLNIIQIP